MEADTTVEEAEGSVVPTPQEDSYTVAEGLRHYWRPPGGENALHLQSGERTRPLRP